MKNLTVTETFSKTQPMVEAKATMPMPIAPIVSPMTGTYRVQSNRVTNSNESTLKTKGAFKIRIQNKGDVGIKVFGNFYMPSYSDETFETGDANLSLAQDSHIEFDEHTISDVVEIVLTSYYKTV